MGDKELKVTDKRMFTADGELREEYRHLGREGGEEEPAARQQQPGAESRPEPASERPPEPAPPPAPAAAAPPAAEAATPPAGDRGPAPGEPSGESARVEIPDTPDSLGAPTFLDLVGLLAEPVALYLGDATLPDGESAENLPMARLHIDLLDLLRQKTVGNLTAQESSVLEDLLYRCRLRYVQKRG